jgi:DNA-binding MarR family transcriptional regulator
LSEHESPLRVGADHERKHAGAGKLATECVINLVRTESLIITELSQRFRAYGLSVATFNVLMILEGAGQPLCPHQIGERLLVTRGTVTGLLDSLEKQGLVRRTPHPGDRRMLLIELTPRAHALLQELLPQHFPAEVEMMSALSEPEKETLVLLLGKIQEHLHRRAESLQPLAPSRLD